MSHSGIQALRFRKENVPHDHRTKDLTLTLEDSYTFTYPSSDLPAGEDILAPNSTPILALGYHNQCCNHIPDAPDTSADSSAFPKWTKALENLPIWASRHLPVRKVLTPWRKRLKDLPRLREQLVQCLSFQTFVLLWPHLEIMTTVWLLSDNDHWEWKHLSNSQLRSMLYFLSKMPLPELLHGIGTE